LLRFDEVVETADLFLYVKPAEATAEQLQVQLMKGAARYFLGFTAAVKDFDVTELQQENTSEITETIQRLEKELEREQSPILLAGIGTLLFRLLVSSAERSF
jgi:hypothetical protein